MTKIIFLDYDGVVKPWDADPAKPPQQTKQVCLEILEEMVWLYPDTKIVLTTDNRFSVPFEELKTWFPSTVADLIIGQTTTEMFHGLPSCSFERIEKYGADVRDKEICKFINDHDLDPEDCIAIDDVWTITCIKQLWTKSDTGLTESTVDEYCDWLNGEMVESTEF